MFVEVLSKRTRIWLVLGSFCRNVLKWSALRKSFGDVRFFEEKVHSLSVAPEPLAIWNKKLEGLESLSLEKLKISFEDMCPAALEHISGFKKNSDRGSFVMFSGSLLSAVELVEWYVVMGCTVLAYYFGYSALECLCLHMW